MESFLAQFPEVVGSTVIALGGMVGYSVKRLFNGLEMSVTTLADNIKDLNSSLTGFNTRLSRLEGEHRANKHRGHEE